MAASAGKRPAPLCIHDIPTWADCAPAPGRPPVTLDCGLNKYPFIGPIRRFDPSLNSLISIVKGDIVRLSVDAIVNAASVSLGSSGGGIDGAIRAAAGPELSKELKGKRCERGQVVVSGGHSLFVKHVLHTVAPHGTTKDADELMRSCYNNCLEHVAGLKLRSLAFCCLGAGIFKFDTTRGAHIAFAATRDWLQQQGVHTVRRIVFCTFSNTDYYIYTHLAPHYFPQKDSTGVRALSLPGRAVQESEVEQ